MHNFQTTVKHTTQYKEI